jgi:molecular chaperone GrpE
VSQEPHASHSPDKPAEGSIHSPHDLTDEASQAAIDSDVAAASLESDVEVISHRVSELTEDLQRVHAEYANYRKRVERDRELVREQAVANALIELIPVLDDVGRARAHGELDGAFRVVGESLEQITTRLGLQRYGDQWDAFDPALHEAIGHEQRDDIPESVTGQACSAVHQPGYRVGSRIVRAALVTVAER